LATSGDRPPSGAKFVAAVARHELADGSTLLSRLPDMPVTDEVRTLMRRRIERDHVSR
jgi:hypothetical protein